MKSFLQKNILLSANIEYLLVKAHEKQIKFKISILNQNSEAKEIVYYLRVQYKVMGVDQA